MSKEGEWNTRDVSSRSWRDDEATDLYILDKVMPGRVERSTCRPRLGLVVVGCDFVNKSRNNDGRKAPCVKLLALGYRAD